jgi:hypothetical protein
LLDERENRFHQVFYEGTFVKKEEEAYFFAFFLRESTFDLMLR